MYAIYVCVCVYVYVYKQARRWAGPMVDSQPGVSASDADRPPSPSLPKEVEEAGERKGGGDGVLSPNGRVPRRLLVREERERWWSNGGVPCG